MLNKKTAFKLRLLRVKEQMDFATKMLGEHPLCEAYIRGYNDCLNFLLSAWPNDEE